MSLYPHERHPLDIAAEEEAKVRERQAKKKAAKVQASITWQQTRPLEELSLQVLQFEVALHLGREYIYVSNKVRKEKNWPVTFVECVEFLTKRGISDEF